MSEFARRNLIIAEGLASNIEDSEEEQIFHLNRAAESLNLEVNTSIEEAKAILWTEVNRRSAFELPFKNIIPRLSIIKKLTKILFFLLAPILLIILIKNSLPVKTLSWEAKYYNNAKFEGKEAISTQHDNISFRWEGAKPNKLVNADKFSAKYKSCLMLDKKSKLNLLLGSDDGSKLFVNKKQIIYNWKKQGYNAIDKTIELDRGMHVFDIHYFQNGGSSRLEFAIKQNGKQKNNKPLEYKLDKCQ